MRLLPLLLLLAPLVASAETVALDYGLEVRIRSFKVDADLWSGAKLRMSATPWEGGTRLLLQRAVEDPWKFYWVAPVVGREEVKYATEASFATPSWEARKAAEQEADRRGRALWQRWKSEWKGTRSFDQSFVFFVIGHPTGRFVVESPAGGGVTSVQNRLTDRWLPTGFSDWIAGKPVKGYGFWASDPRPPEWEPHGYDALAAAVKLLSVPVAEGDVRHPDVAKAARHVLETLVPKTKGQFGGAADVVLPMRVTVVGASRPIEGTHRIIEGTSAPVKVSGQSGMSLVLHRRVVLDETNRPLGDRARVELTKGDELSLKLSVGWGP